MLFRSQEEHAEEEKEKEKDENRPWQQDPGWEFQCTCGVRCTDEDHPSKHPVGEQFECSKCGIWCHVKCAYDDEATLETIPTRAVCPLCMNIDALEESEQPKQSKRQHSSSQLMASKKRPRRRSAMASFQVGSEVYVYFFDGSHEPGVIEKLEDGAAKVHFDVRLLLILHD